MIDLHCHILPGVDDGARTLDDAREMARAAAAEGVTAIAATPHVRADYPTRAARVEHGVSQLRLDFAQEGIAIDVLHGAEIELGRLWEIPPDELQRLSIAQRGRHVLLEFPYRGWPHGLEAAFASLRVVELTPILAHPERNPEIQDRPARLAAAVAAGALVQVTAASLDGRLGGAARAAAERLVSLRLVHLLASDAHGPHRRNAGLAAAVEALGDVGLARYLTTDAPAAIVAGERVEPLRA